MFARRSHPRRPEMATRRWLRRSAWLAAVFLLIPCAYAKEGMSPKTRIAIIRGLLREQGVTKVALPRGKRGARVDAQGKLDQAEVQKEMQTNGMAMKAGTPAVITKIVFKSNQLVIEVNGGGRTHEKWYQHIEIDGGMAVTPVASDQAQAPAFGSSITVDFGRPLPDLTVAQVKNLLASTLDFERHLPTVLYSPNVPPKVKEAIKNHQVIVGMDRDAVLSAKGIPDRRVREVRDGEEQDDWIYGTPPHVLFVTFDGDKVVDVHQY